MKPENSPALYLGDKCCSCVERIWLSISDTSNQQLCLPAIWKRFFFFYRVRRHSRGAGALLQITLIHSKYCSLTLLTAKVAKSIPAVATVFRSTHLAELTTRKTTTRLTHTCDKTQISLKAQPGCPYPFGLHSATQHDGPQLPFITLHPRLHLWLRPNRSVW